MKQKSKEKKSENISKEFSNELTMKIFRNILLAILVILYLIVLGFANERMQQERFIGDIKVFAGTFLILGILFFEQAYKRESGYRAITGIEMTVLSAYTLSAMHIISKFEYDFATYVKNTMYVIAVYYIIKCLIIYTNEKKKSVEKYNDISEIIKDEPQKKEAKKRKNIKTVQTKKNEKSSKKNNNTKSKKMTSTNNKLSKKKEEN